MIGNNSRWSKETQIEILKAQLIVLINGKNLVLIWNGKMDKSNEKCHLRAWEDYSRRKGQYSKVFGGCEMKEKGKASCWLRS